jgi:hypothetical protein
MNENETPTILDKINQGKQIDGIIAEQGKKRLFKIKIGALCMLGIATVAVIIMIFAGVETEKAWDILKYLLSFCGGVLVSANVPHDLPRKAGGRGALAARVPACRG